MFDGLDDSPVLEKRPNSRTRPAHAASSTRMETTLRKQFAVIPALVEDADIRLLGDVIRVTESISDTKVIPVIRTVVSRSLAKGFWNATFYLAVDGAVHKCVSEPLSVDSVAEKLVDAPSSTVRVAEFINDEV